MAKKNYQKLSPRALEHVLTWGDVCRREKKWTKSDANIYELVKREAAHIRHKDYLKRKAVKMNPHLDSDQPYHTT